MSSETSRINPLAMLAVSLLICSPLLIPAARRTWSVLTAPAPAPVTFPAVPTLDLLSEYETKRIKAGIPKHIESDLEFKELPPGMCWARVKGKPVAWSYGVRRLDGAWLLLPCHFQPVTIEDAQNRPRELSRQP